MRNFPMPLQNDRGVVLVVGLLFVAILTILGVSAIIYTSIDLSSSGNYRQARTAFYAAEAGIEEVKLRLKGTSADANYAGDPAATPNPLWTSYIITSVDDWDPSVDPEYHADYTNYFPVLGGLKTAIAVSANSIQNSASYGVKIRHKREYDAEQDSHSAANILYTDGDGSGAAHSGLTPADRGNIIYYGRVGGSSSLVQFTIPAGDVTDYYPVEVIMAVGSSGNSKQIFKAEIVRNPGPEVFAALYAKGNVTLNGTAMSVDGTDNCGSAAAKPPVYTLNPSTTTTNGSPTYGGTPAAPTAGANDVDILDIVDMYKKGNKTTISADNTSGATWGLGTYYCNTDDLSPPGELKLKIQGSGVLIVEGDLNMVGGFQWNGIVLVTGTAIFAGGGGVVNIRGTIMANSSATVSGGIDIRYDSCKIEDAIVNQSLSMITWKQVH